MSKKVYIIYATFKNNNRTFHAWSENKNIINTFMQQRSSKKYFVSKTNVHNYTDEFPEDLMIDFIVFESVKTKQKYYIFVTASELNYFESRIRQVFKMASSIEKIDPTKIQQYVNLFLNLKPEYFNALHYIGFRPKEIHEMYDGGMDSLYGHYDRSYEGMSCEEFYTEINTVHTESANDIADKLYYSLESFIKIMIEWL